MWLSDTINWIVIFCDYLWYGSIMLTLLRLRQLSPPKFDCTPLTGPDQSSRIVFSFMRMVLGIWSRSLAGTNPQSVNFRSTSNLGEGRIEEGLECPVWKSKSSNILQRLVWSCRMALRYREHGASLTPTSHGLAALCSWAPSDRLDITYGRHSLLWGNLQRKLCKRILTAVFVYIFFMIGLFFLILYNAFACFATRVDSCKITCLKELILDLTYQNVSTGWDT